MNLLDIMPASDGSGFDWPTLCEAFDWIAGLRGVPQDPEHHAEGDVATHACMVCEALLDSEAWRVADAGRRRRLFLAVLLHDVAKPVCTRRDPDGRVSSRGHSRRGAVLAREILWRAGVDLLTREAVCGIVEHHQVPFWLLERDDVARKTIEVAVTTSWNELCIHAAADARGRLCSDQASLLEKVALAGEMARELGCFDAPRCFASDRARIAFLQRNRDDALYGHPAGLEPRSTVTLVCGLPGSGKDTWIAANMQDHRIVSLDAIRAELGVAPSADQGRVASVARDRARVYLRAGSDFVLNATNVSRDMRSRWITLCRDYDAAVQIVFVETDPATLRERNLRRDRPVPWPLIERMIRRWEHPNEIEAERVWTVVG
jgi:predicted kinase